MNIEKKISFLDNIPCLKNSNFLDFNEKKIIYNLFFNLKNTHDNIYLSSFILLNDNDYNKFFKLCNDILKIGFKNYCYKKILFDIENLNIIHLFFNNILISKEINIKSISFDYNIKFNNDIINSLGICIENNLNIEYISIQNYTFKDNHIEILLPYLKYNKNIKSLDFSSSKKITNKSIQYFIDIINNSNIIDIKTNNTLITENKIFFFNLINNLFKNKHETISYSNYNLNDDDINILINYIDLYKINNIKNISFLDNFITSKNIFKLLKILNLNNNQITYINLENNLLDDNYIENLGEFIFSINYVINFINLSYNNISDEGIKILKNYIINNFNISELDLSYNKKITNNSFIFFKDIMQKSLINNLYLNGINISIVNKEILKLIKKINILPINKDDDDNNNIASNSKMLKI